MNFWDVVDINKERNSDDLVGRGRKDLLWKGVLCYLFNLVSVICFICYVG